MAFSVEDGRPVGVARLVRLRDDPETADVAVAVVDAWQARGVGTSLASSLVARARSSASAGSRYSWPTTTRAPSG